MQTNNKLRETMIEVLEYIETFHKYITPGKGKKLTALFAVADTIRDKARAALAEPIKNCDVGTAEEQTARYRRFCSSHKYLGSDFSHVCRGFGKGRCPFFGSHTKSQCEFAWAQTPYEEGGDK